MRVLCVKKKKVFIKLQMKDGAVALENGLSVPQNLTWIYCVPVILLPSVYPKELKTYPDKNVCGNSSIIHNG